MTTQIAVKLPDPLLADIDRMVAKGEFESRSDAVRHAVASLVRGDERRRIDEAFAEAFRRVPDTQQEIDEATRLALESIHDEPWERWW